ncbi:hypothetical protein ABD74_13070 [Brevibacillus laterosporus]|nr:hypothetical protein [Brevibacillus laterosporus]
MYKLQYYRKKKGLSQNDMALKLGMSVHGYRKYEQGIRRMSLETAFKIKTILQVDHIEDFLENAI